MKLLENNVLIKGTIKNTGIVLPETQKDQRTIDKLEVYALGKEVKNVKVGDDVMLPLVVMSEKSRFINPFKDKKPEEGEFYLVVKENEIIGVYE